MKTLLRHWLRRLHEEREAARAARIIREECATLARWAHRGNDR